MAKYPESDPLEQEEKWGMPLRDLYRLALSFYKQNSGKAIHLSYEDNLKLVAFTKQATNGPYNEKCAPALGVLDYIGKDRRQYWQQLGDMGKVQSMEGFINLLDRMCSSFKPYIEAVKQDNEAKLKLELQKNVESMKKLEKEKQLREKEQLLEEERYKEEIQRRQLKDALNQQTYQQFKSYAEKQFPGSPEEQAILIRQLQKEHYHQYMQQLHLNANAKPTIPPPSVTAEESETIENDSKQSAGSEQGIYEKNESENDEYVVISPAKMWTRPDIKAFKKDVAAGSGDGVINVGHGDIVTVRVPTNSNGKCIFWEFATDNYDIGFGVFFEWSPPVTNDVTVHVSESDDDDFYDDEDYLVNDDLECGSVANVKSVEYNKAPISIIVPIYRRECFNEVYVGSHAYPGQGVYLLKFDNSFSIWRSKMLYYRVYYER